MSTVDGRFTLVYNGEVYNFRELRRELEGEGAVLAPLGHGGSAAGARAGGAGAGALQRHVRARSVGTASGDGCCWRATGTASSPWYWARLGEAFVFASEVKGLFPHPAWKVRADPEAVYEYFTFQNMFGERTLFDGVQLLPPGSLMRIGPDGSRTDRYWDFDFHAPATEDERNWLEELHRLFRQAVTRQLVADVPVGSYLSGGMDSGSISCVGASEIDNLRTFTVGFDLSSASGMEPAFDERRKAERMSYLFGTEHYEMVLKAGDMERVMSRLMASRGAAGRPELPQFMPPSSHRSS